MDFKYVQLTDGQYGAWLGSGLKRSGAWYVSDAKYGLGTTANDTLNEDYYMIWNLWPTFDGSLSSYTNDVSGTALNDIGIAALTVHVGDGATLTGTLDCAIVRKSNRSAVRIIVTGTNKAHYKGSIHSEGVITAINPTEGPWSPEMGRKQHLGYL